MTFDETLDKLIGDWTGESTLHLSWMTPPEYHSKSILTAAKAVGGKFLTLEYTWHHENNAQAGFLLLGFDKNQEIVYASWADSWHSSVKPMALTGKINAQNAIDLFGTYEVPNHPDWGWKILVTPTADALQVKMHNVSPEGKDDLAVQAEYKRIM